MEHLELTDDELLMRELTETNLSPLRTQQLADFVLREMHHPAPNHTRRTVGIVGIAVVLGAATAGTAAAWRAETATPNDPYLAYCYPDDTLARGADWAGTTVATPLRADGTHNPVDAIAACHNAWQSGLVHTPGTTPAEGTTQPVPELHACVTDDSHTAVFPGDATVCDRVGLPSLG